MAKFARTKRAVAAALVAVAIVLLGTAPGQADGRPERHHESAQHHRSDGHHDRDRNHHRFGVRSNGIYWIPYTYYWPPLPTYPTPTYWYYCPSFATYYPYVASCPDAWLPVPAS